MSHYKLDNGMEDCKFLDSFKDKRLKLTLKSVTYMGTVVRVGLNRVVVLRDVVDIRSGRKLSGVKLFFGHEIVNVEFPDALADDHGGNGGSDHGVQGAELTVAEFQPYRNNMELGDDDDESECVDFVVIDTFSEKFRPAVMHIYKQKVISIAADSIGDVPHERLCWLQIATNNKVYLFDILLLGAKAFKNGLSMTLENKHILKVVHDCRSMAACLLTQYGVSLANVFDTQVADVAHFYMETGGFLPDRVSTLQEVVALHLEVPPSRLEALNLMSEISKENKKVWHVRPCPLSLLKMMVFSVIYLQPLRLVLLDGLMSDITSLMDSYLEISLQEMVPTQHIGSSNRLALPSELRRLEQKKQERRQRAVDMYPLTADGLLLRFSPKPLKDPIFQADLNTPLPATAVQPAAQMVPSSVSSLPRTIPAGNPGRVQIVGPTSIADLSGGGNHFLQMFTHTAGAPSGVTKAYMGSRRAENPIPGAAASTLGGRRAADRDPIEDCTGSFPDCAVTLGRGHFFHRPGGHLA